jgi:amino acid adenylation domain-containing protein
MEKTIDRTSIQVLSSMEINQEPLYLGVKDVAYLKKLTKGNTIAQQTFFIAIYSFLLRKLVYDFDGQITIYNLEGLSGPVNFIISEIESGCSFKEYLLKTKEEVLKSVNHSDLGSGSLQSRGISGGMGIFSIAFNSSSPLPCNGMLLNIHLEDYNERIAISITTLKDFEDREVVWNFQQCFINFIINLPSNTDLSADFYSLADEATQQLVLKEFNRTARAWPFDKTIVDLFEEQVNKTPDNDAVISGQGILSYNALNDRVNQMAAYICAHTNISKGDVIGVFMPKSEAAVIALLAVLKLGAVYLPLDTQYPIDRINTIIKDSGLTLLLINGTATALQLDLDILTLDIHGFIGKGYRFSYPQVKPEPADAAYLIYTSGSTGTPKGVLVPHRGNVNMSLDQVRIFEIAGSDKVVWFASTSFDASISEVMMCFYSGAALCIPSEDVIRDSGMFATFLHQTGATTVTLPPSYLDLLSEKDIQGLRRIITAGEPADTGKALAVMQMGVDYYNAYGPTEYAVCATMYKVTAADLGRKIIPIGRPVANTSIYILDRDMQPVPVGVAGCMYISGAGLAICYLNLPELTQEKFIANPFYAGGTMYDTGDLARWLPDGNLEFLGRRDHQVKLRGYRIEPEETETVIKQFAEPIKQAVVAVKQVNGENHLVAYIVAASINKDALKQFLHSKLPQYMVPAYYILLPLLPLTPNGKVDRKRLPEVDLGNQSHSIYTAPRSITEEHLALIWQEVLGIERVGVHDSFFDLGGHSLLVSRVLSRMRQELGISSSFRDFFANPTIDGLSRHHVSVQYKPIPASTVPGPYPLTASQHRFWILSQLEGGSSAYNMPAAVRLSGFFDVSHLEASYRLLIHRHEILRTVYRTGLNGLVYQHILPFDSVNFQIHRDKVSDIPGGINGIEDYLSEKSGEVFDLEFSVPLKVWLLEISPDDHIVLFSIHHIAGDGLSTDLLVSDLLEFFSSCLMGRAVSLAPLRIQYKDYALWLEKEQSEPRYEALWRYWKERLGGELPVLDLPGYVRRPLIQTYNGSVCRHHYPLSLRTLLKSFCHEHDVTLFMVLMSGVRSLLYRYSGQTDIITGTVSGGRTHPDLTGQVGLYLNTLAIRTQLHEGVSFLELVSLEKEALLGAYEHQDYPFDDLVNRLDVKRDRSRSPLFDVFVVLHHAATESDALLSDQLPGIGVRRLAVSKRSSQFDLSFSFTDYGDSFTVDLEYNTDLYDGAFAGRICGHFEQLLLLMLSEPSAPVANHNYLGIAESNLLLKEYNQTSRSHAGTDTIADLFEKQVKKTPASITLMDDTVSYTYSELSILSDNVAAYINTVCGNQEKCPIAVMHRRSADLIIILLGILKTGRAYIPLDPHFPLQRLQHIVDSSQVKVMISDEQNSLKTNYEILTINAADMLLHTVVASTSIFKNRVQVDDTAYIIYTTGSTQRRRNQSQVTD